VSCELPVTTSGLPGCCFSSTTVPAKSALMMVVGCQAASVSVEEATYFGRPYKACDQVTLVGYGRQILSEDLVCTSAEQERADGLEHLADVRR
jgi:hypothetical protein